MQNFIDRMEGYDDDGLMDIENDWKMVSIFIGGNDLCGYCNNQVFKKDPWRPTKDFQNCTSLYMDTVIEQYSG